MATTPECPKCPGCGEALGTPAVIDCGVDPGRWYGPPEANLFCPACGTGWVGTAAELADAWAAWRVYEAEMASFEEAGH